MFGALPFGTPYFAQGTGQGAAASLAASATLSVSTTAALTKPAAQLTAAATVSFSGAAAFGAVAPQLAAQATITVGVAAALTKPAASLAATATFRVSSTAGPLTGSAAALASTATVSITTASAVLTGSAAHLVAHATLAVTSPASTLTGTAAALTASTTLQILVAPPPLTNVGAAAALATHATLAVTTTRATLTGIAAALSTHATLAVTARATLSDLVGAATVLISTAGAALTRPANADEKACGAPFPIDPALGVPPCTGSIPIDPDRPVRVPAAFETHPTLAVTTRGADLTGIAAVLAASASWRFSTQATVTHLLNPLAATATLRVLVTALPPHGVAAALVSAAPRVRISTSAALTGGSPVLSASASFRVLVPAAQLTGIAATLASTATFALTGQGTLVNPSAALATATRLSIASPGALLDLARYVATTGLDTNPGTWALPYRTITKGVSVLQPGNLLSIRGGTYDEGLGACPSGTSWTNPVRIAAYQNEVVWMTPTTPLSGNPGACVRFTGNEHHVEFDGINMDGSTAGVYDTVAFVASPSGEPHHVRLKNATLIAMRTDNSAFSAFAAHGVEYHGGLPTLIGGFELINLRITGGGRPFTGDFSHNGYAIYLAGPNNLVDGCDLSDNKGAGVHIFNDDGQSPDNNIVRNCVIHDQSRNSNIGQLYGILNVGNNNRIYNNLVYNIFGPGIDSGGQGLAIAASNNEVQDNTVYACLQYGILVGAGALRRRAPLPPLPTPQAVGTLVRNNISYNSGTNYANLGTSTLHTTSIDDGTNPLFTNEATHDFTVKPGSPAILAGVGVAYIPTDLTGRPRPTSGPCTIGAYEFVATTATRKGRG